MIILPQKLSEENDHSCLCIIIMLIFFFCGILPRIQYKHGPSTWIFVHRVALSFAETHIIVFFFNHATPVTSPGDTHHQPWVRVRVRVRVSSIHGEKHNNVGHPPFRFTKRKQQKNSILGREVYTNHCFIKPHQPSELRQKKKEPVEWRVKKI